MDLLLIWRPVSWTDYLLIYIAPGILMSVYLLIKTWRERSSDFAKGLMKAMGKEETWIDKLKDAFVFNLGLVCVVFGWPGFVVWLIKDKIDDAARQKRYDEPDFSCLQDHLISKVNPTDAEITSYIIDPCSTVPSLPFGHLNKGWVNFLSDMTDDRDEMWSFCIPKGSKYGKYRRTATSEIKGYARVRNDKVLAEFITEAG